VNVATASGSWLLPGLPGARVIRVESLPNRLAGGIRVGPGLEAMPGSILISIQQIARYLCSNGVAIEVATMPRADPGAVETFLDGPARAALIHQRGELPLLSTTVISPQGEAVVLCGATGVGKSSVGAALSLRGWSLLAEGVTRIGLDAGQVIAHPSHTAFKLWRDTCEWLGIDTAGFRQTRADFDKFYVPATAVSHPVRVAAIVRLRPDPKVFGDEPDTSGRKLLESHSYKNELAVASGAGANQERVISAIVDQCQFLIVEGAHADPLPAVADKVAEAVA